MAKKIPKVKQILDVSMEDINRMTAKELRANVQILASAANKRLSRLSQSEIGKIAPAYLSAMKRSYTGREGGKFGTAGKTRNQLLNEFKAAKSFLEMKTSSVKGWTKFRSSSYKRAGVKPSDDPEKEKMFWKTYRKIEELYPNIKSMAYGSKETQTDLRRVMNEEASRTVLAEINNVNLQNREFVTDADGNVMQTGEMIMNATNDFVVDENGVVYDVDVNDPDDILKIMQLKVGIEYERQQFTEADDEFYEFEDDEF